MASVRRALPAVVVLKQEDIMRDRRRAVVAALLGLATLLMAPETGWTQEDAIRKLVGEDYDKAMAAGNVSAKMRLYTADAVLMPPEGPVVSGQDAIRLWHESFFKKGTSPGVSKVDEVQLFGEWGFARGTFAGTVTPRPGASPTSVSEKWLVVVRRQGDGSWKIARDIWTQEPQSAKTK
jgi:uncharacterized protein (TIGR02246 family)